MIVGVVNDAVSACLPSVVSSTTILLAKTTINPTTNFQSRIRWPFASSSVLAWFMVTFLKAGLSGTVQFAIDKTLLSPGIDMLFVVSSSVLRYEFLSMIRGTVVHYT